MERRSFQELNILDICQINLLHIHAKSQKIYPIQYFPTTLKLLTILKFENGFSKHNFKRTRWFLKICKIFDKLSRLKIRELLTH